LIKLLIIMTFVTLKTKTQKLGTLRDKNASITWWYMQFNFE